MRQKYDAPLILFFPLDEIKFIAAFVKCFYIVVRKTALYFIVKPFETDGSPKLSSPALLCASAVKNQIAKALSAPYAAPFNSGIEKVNTEGGIYSVQARFLLWIMQLYDILNGKQPTVSVPPSTFSAQVIMYMNEYFGEKISVIDIANAMNTS